MIFVWPGLFITHQLWYPQFGWSQSWDKHIISLPILCVHIKYYHSHIWLWDDLGKILDIAKLWYYYILLFISKTFTCKSKCAFFHIDWHPHTRTIQHFNSFAVESVIMVIAPISLGWLNTWEWLRNNNAKIVIQNHEQLSKTARCCCHCSSMICNIQGYQLFQGIMWLVYHCHLSTCGSVVGGALSMPGK